LCEVGEIEPLIMRVPKAGRAQPAMLRLCLGQCG
jgi:hypothetical protein